MKKTHRNIFAVANGKRKSVRLMLLQVFFLLLNMEKMLVPITFSFVNFTKEPFFRRKLRQVKIHVISLFLSVCLFFSTFSYPKIWLFIMVKHQNSLSRSLEAIVLASCFLKNKKNSLGLWDDYLLTYFNTFWLNYFDDFMQNVNTNVKHEQRKNTRNKIVLEMEIAFFSLTLSFKTLCSNVEFGFFYVFRMVLRNDFTWIELILIRAKYAHTKFVKSLEKLCIVAVIGINMKYFMQIRIVLRRKAHWYNLST